MNVSVEKIDSITIVTLSRPEVRNAVDSATALELYQAFVAFEQDDAARVAVFHGAHGHFCAGWDLQAAARLAEVSGTQNVNRNPGEPSSNGAGVLSNLNFAPNDVRSFGQASSISTLDQGSKIGPLGPMGPSRLLLSKPVIAAVSGAAVAGGMELALWCDMRVMEEAAYFGVYCRRFGVPLIDGGTVRLPRLIGMGHAMDLILTGRKVEAAEALQMGLANRVVPSGQARAAAISLAQQLAAFPQSTLQADRMSAYTQWDLPLPQALHQEWERGKHCIGEGLAGAARFAGGVGRHGKF